ASSPLPATPTTRNTSRRSTYARCTRATLKSSSTTKTPMASASTAPDSPARVLLIVPTPFPLPRTTPPRHQQQATRHPGAAHHGPRPRQGKETCTTDPPPLTQ